MVGQNLGTVTGCYNTGTVTGTMNVGGVVGNNNGGTVKNCYNTGAVEGDRWVGGVVGENWGTMTGCYNAGAVSGDFYVGGVVGYNSDDGAVTSCYNTGTVTGGGSVGGVIGEDNGAVTSCYNTGTVTGGGCAGGVVGEKARGDATGCYNTGTVKGSDDDVGGVVGMNEGAVENCYNFGAVSGNADIGGVVGWNYDGAAVTNCYYLAGTAEAGVGINTGTGTGSAAVLTADAFKDPASFADWDFTAVWQMSVILGRPILRADPEPEPVPIYTRSQLEAFRDAVNGGESYEGVSVKLMEDIPLGGEANPWTPIGTSSNSFKGTFDGGGHQIAGMYINSGDNCHGVFGYVGPEGAVKNLGVDGTVTGSRFVGGVVGWNKGTVAQCYFDGPVHGADFVGGVVGNNDSGSVENCFHGDGQVSASDPYASVGGVVGANGGIVKNCYNIGPVSGDDDSDVGGVVGAKLEGTVENCYYLADTEDDQIGGIDSSDAEGQAESKTTEQFAKQDQFVDWDFTAVWKMSETLKRPILQDNPEPDVLEIATRSELEAFRNAVNAGNSYKGKTVKLTDNIDLEGSETDPWTPIGDNAHHFNATFDGNGHQITGLYINASGSDYQGLFGTVGEGGTVKNLSVSGTVKGNDHVGGVVGRNYGTVSNSYNTGTIAGNCYVGGVVGMNDGAVENCYSTGGISGDSPDVRGGVVGYSNGGTATNCYYLSTCGAKGAGTAKTETQFNSGEVAHLLQGTQATQAWGQTLTGAGKDGYPVLTAEAGKKVYKVTFLKGGAGSAEHAAGYTNDGGTVALPTAPTSGGTFKKWATDTAGSTEFTATTAITADTTVYAIYKATPEYTAPTGLAGAVGAQLTTVTLPDGWAWVDGTQTLTSGTQTFQATYTPADTDNYDVVTVSLTVTGKKTPTVSITHRPLMYSGQAQALVLSGSTSGGTLQYSLDNATRSTDVPTGTDAKAYTVYYRVVGNGEYLDVAAQSVTATIQPWPIFSATVTLGDSLTYNGSAQTQTVTAVTVGNNVPATFTVTGNTGTNAGDYTLTVTGTGNFAGTKDVDFTIAKAKNDITNFKCDDIVHGETPAPSAKATSGTPTFTYSNSEDGAFGPWSSANHKGTWYVKASVAEGDNYLGAEKVISFVENAEREKTPAATIGYAEETLTGLVPGAGYQLTPAGGEAVTMSANDSGSISIDKTWFGTDLALVKVPQSADFSSSKPQSLTVPARPTAPTAPVKLKKTADSITVTDGASGCELSVDGADWQGDGAFTDLAAGTEYSVQVRVKATDTSFKSDSMTQTVTTVGEDGAATVKPGETVDIPGGQVTGEDNGDVKVTTGESGVTTVTPPKAGTGEVVVDTATGKVSVPVGATVTADNGVKVTVDAGAATVDPAGAVTLPAGGKVTVTDAGGNKTPVTVPTGGVVDPADYGKKPAPSVPPSTGSASASNATVPVVAQPSHGKVNVTPARPRVGDKVTVTVTPEAGYSVDTVTATTPGGKPVEVTREPDGTFSFIQPGVRVTVSATMTEADAEDGTGDDTEDSNCPVAAFDDLEVTGWYHDGVHYCLEHGLMVGISDTVFAPNMDTDRAMLATILWRMAGSPAMGGGKSGTFTDVAENAWCTEAIEWVAAKEIVNGYGNGTFGPSDPLTREQLAAMLYRYAGSPAAEGSLDGFADSDKAGPWAVDALKWAVEQGILTGRGNGILAPAGTATRAEAATMLQRYLTGTEK